MIDLDNGLVNFPLNNHQINFVIPIWLIMNRVYPIRNKKSLKK